jgi:hypothetical protein
MMETPKVHQNEGKEVACLLRKLRRDKALRFDINKLVSLIENITYAGWDVHPFLDTRPEPDVSNAHTEFWIEMSQTHSPRPEQRYCISLVDHLEEAKVKHVGLWAGV